jgi:histidine ammonia-lyase
MSSKSDKAAEIGTRNLSLDDVEKLAQGSTRIVLAAESSEKVEASRQMVVSAISAGMTVYGVTTGFGALSERRISPDKARELQINLLRSHAKRTCGPLPRRKAHRGGPVVASGLIPLPGHSFTSKGRRC